MPTKDREGAREYRERAIAARKAAELEPLEHVRKKHLDAAAAWERMALPPAKRADRLMR